ncbi:MAG: exlusion protein FxsA [Acidiferrobacteraceae bacterium]|nr:exlusion protein FxsA [Acidiferrobacteraceae bacterium]
MPVFILFVVVTFAEIYLLIKMGATVGVTWTILLVLLTAVVGAWLVRLQGIAAWRRFQTSIARHHLPAEPLVEGLCLLLAGALLLIPGFVTDIIGFTCLVPPIRRMMLRYLTGRLWSGKRPDSSHPAEPLDATYRRIDD